MLVLWDIETGQQMFSLPFLASSIPASLLVDNDGTVYAADSLDQICILNIMPYSNAPNPYQPSITSLDIGDDRKHFAVAYSDRRIELWSLNLNSKIKFFNDEISDSMDLSFNNVSIDKDANRILQFDDKELKLWAIDSGEILKRIPFEGLQCVSFLRGSINISADAKCAAGVFKDDKIRVINILSKRLTDIPFPNGYAPVSTSITTSGSMVFVNFVNLKSSMMNCDVILEVFNKDGKKLQQFTSMQFGLPNIVCSKNDLFALTFNCDSAQIWQIENGIGLKAYGREIKIIDSEYTNEEIGILEVAAISQDARKIVIASSNKKLKVWDVESHRVLATFSSDHHFTSCLFTSDSNTIIAGDSAGIIHLLDLVD